MLTDENLLNYPYNTMTKSNRIYERQLLKWIQAQKGIINLHLIRVQFSGDEIGAMQKNLENEKAMLKLNKEALKNTEQELKDFYKRIK